MLDQNRRAPRGNEQNISYALLGAGRTGSQISELLHPNESLTIFDRINKPTEDLLRAHDVIISFLPAEAFEQYIPMLITSNKPVVVGTTGGDWQQQVHTQLLQLERSWIHAKNFSLGMNLIKPLMAILSKASDLFYESSFEIRETHHVGKLDAPSGTALSIEQWLGQDVEISSERINDVIGEHKVIVHTPYEEITVKHKALSRKIFAQGALWSCRYLLSNEVPKGLVPFEYISDQRIANLTSTEGVSHDSL